MTLAKAVLIVVGSLVAGRTVVAATTDDIKRINQCVKNNMGKGANESVVLKYCTCMNNQMPRNEIQPVTQWEQTHAAEQRDCSRAAGWN